MLKALVLWLLFVWSLFLTVALVFAIMYFWEMSKMIGG